MFGVLMLLLAIVGCVVSIAVSCAAEAMTPPLFCQDISGYSADVPAAVSDSVEAKWQHEADDTNHIMHYIDDARIW